MTDYRGGRGGVGGLSGAWYSQKFSAARQTPPFRSHPAAALVGGDADEPLYEADVQPLINAMTPMITSGTNRCFMAALPPNSAYTLPSDSVPGDSYAVTTTRLAVARQSCCILRDDVRS